MLAQDYMIYIEKLNLLLLDTWIGIKDVDFFFHGMSCKIRIVKKFNVMSQNFEH